MIKTVDNFNSAYVDQQQRGKGIAFGKNNYFFESTKKRKELFITLKDYRNKSDNNQFFSFFRKGAEKEDYSDNDLIISLKKDINGDYHAQTGNYIGQFVWDGLTIEIGSRFQDLFLKRMLNVANNVYFDDVDVAGAKSKELDISKFIIYYLFVQNLEKAFLLGIPKIYKSVNRHDMRPKGKIDIHRFIKNDIPFKGKVSSQSRDQQEIQEIIDTLYKALKIIESHEFSIKNIMHIKTHLKQHKSTRYVSKGTISKAMRSKALQNPIYAQYKKVLEYAKMVIEGDNLETRQDGSKKTYGFLINVAELFEVYIIKLLQKEFSDWYVDSHKIPLYEGLFYSRKIIPDIVMMKNKSVLVFDTKYKKMTMQGKDQYGLGDVDRNDFFQINTYMSYYQNQGYDLKAGGLLYPMDKFDKTKSHSDHWLGNSQTKFVVDGIDLSSIHDNTFLSDIAQYEKKFIANVKSMMR